MTTGVKVGVSCAIGAIIIALCCVIVGIVLYKRHKRKNNSESYKFTLPDGENNPSYK